MRPSNVILILALTILAVIFSLMPVHAYTPQYNPSEIAVDTDGNVYAMMNKECQVGEGVIIYAPDGTEMKAYLREGYSDIAIDGNGTVYALNIARKQVERLEKNGSFSVVWRQDNPHHFINYFAIDRGNNILVSDFNYSDAEIKVTDGYILKISPEGNILGVIESSPEVPLDRPFRLSVSGNGTVYLTNFGGNFSAIYPDGSRSTIARVGPDNGNFSQVQTVEAGNDGYLYVGEAPGGRVRKLTTDGTLVAQWEGCGPDRFIGPGSIVAGRDGRVYVSDMQNQRIIWFDSNTYRFGENPNENLAGKGVLWDDIVAGDNYSTVINITDHVPVGPGMPGFEATVALIGIALAGAIACSGRLRQK